ncbi:hypothetical protein C1H46_003160 [Malus baccata]|uniref:Uncharacterized protein n=1 Tax=Malus baccata TaxID=106549 RepID=A0A540NJD9_MALBA|nr:hypothetical protein C1H46_003160 [Malus baccata]
MVDSETKPIRVPIDRRKIVHVQINRHLPNLLLSRHQYHITQHSLSLSLSRKKNQNPKTPEQKLNSNTESSSCPKSQREVPKPRAPRKFWRLREGETGREDSENFVFQIFF